MYQEHRNYLGAGIGAIALGAMLRTLDNALFEGVVDLTVLESYYNNSLTGTLVPRWKSQSEEKQIQIPEGRYKELLQLATKDPSLGFFFTPAHKLSSITTYHIENPLYFPYLPDELHAFMKETDMLPMVPNWVVPEYTPRAQQVITTLRRERLQNRQQSA